MKKITTIALLISLSPYAPAARSAEVLNWDQSITQAKENNSELKAARESFQALLYNSRGAYSNFFPQLTASFAYNRGNSTTSTGGGSGLLAGPTTTTSRITDTYTLSLSAAQNLFNGLQDKAKVDQASANARAQEAALLTTQARISYDLKVAYAGLLYAQRAVKLQMDIISRRKENQRLVELRFDSGRENKGSVLLAHAYLNQANYDEMLARNNIQTARVQLSRVLGIDEEREFEITQDIPMSLPPQEIDYRSLALNTPDHFQSEAQAEAADAGFALARGSFFPILGMTGSMSKQDRDWYPQNDRWTIGVNVSFPFFTGGKDYYATKSAAANYRAAVLNKSNIDRVLTAKIKSAYLNYREAVQKVIVDESFQKAAILRASISREKYNNGLLTFENWDIIENDLIARQKTYLQTMRDRTVAEAAYEQALGKGVFHD